MLTAVSEADAAVDSDASEAARLPAASALAAAEGTTPAAVSDASAATTSQAANKRAVVFGDMHLKVGDQVFFEPLRPLGGGRVTVGIVGWLPGGSIIVTAPQNALGRVVMLEGDQVVLRAFTGKSAFAFRATVLKAVHQPYAYVHLSFPDKIEGIAIRSSPRCRVRLPVQVTQDGGEAGRGDIVNIGMSGVLIETEAPLASDQSPV